MDSEGRDAVHSAIQKLQRDPDRDVRYFAGVNEDALDLTFEDHALSSYHTALVYNPDDTVCTPEEEEECEVSEGSGVSIEGMGENVSSNVDVRTETLDSMEQLEGGDHTSLDEAYMETPAETSVTLEFEENERRLDIESEDALAIASEFHVGEEAGAEQTERNTEVINYFKHQRMRCSTFFIRLAV